MMVPNPAWPERRREDECCRGPSKMPSQDQVIGSIQLACFTAVSLEARK